jgi:hypothetical protein
MGQGGQVFGGKGGLTRGGCFWSKPAHRFNCRLSAFASCGHAANQGCAAVGQNRPPSALPRALAIGVSFVKELPAGVLKPRDFNGSVGAIGGRVLKGPTFFGPGHHSHSTSEHAAFDAARDLVRVTQGGNIMTRRTIIMLTGMTLLGLAFAASPQVALAQSDPFDGIWQANLAKSNPGPFAGLKSVTHYFHGEGQNRRDTEVGIDAQGNPFSVVRMHIYDGQPHPTTGSTYDASATTRVDAHTINYSLTKAGKVVVTGALVVSQDGKTLTATAKGTDANGREYNDVAVLDKP